MITKREEAIGRFKRFKVINLTSKIDKDLEQIILELLEIAAELQYEEVTLLINSGGGEWFSAVAIYNAICLAQAYGVKVTGIVFGRCYSGAAVILQACEVRKMMFGSAILMHWGHDGLTNEAQTAMWLENSTWIEEDTNALNAQMLLMLNARATHESFDVFIPLCRNQQRLSPVQAETLRLIDEVIDGTKLQLVILEEPNIKANESE